MCTKINLKKTTTNLTRRNLTFLPPSFEIDYETLINRRNQTHPDNFAPFWIIQHCDQTNLSSLPTNRLKDPSKSQRSSHFFLRIPNCAKKMINGKNCNDKFGSKIAAAAIWKRFSADRRHYAKLHVLAVRSQSVPYWAASSTFWQRVVHV